MEPDHPLEFPMNDPGYTYGEGTAAHKCLLAAQNAGIIQDHDWQASTDGEFFLINFGGGVVEYTAAKVVAVVMDEYLALITQFNAAGGRGVELADRIDTLRALLPDNTED